ncbi:mobilization protein [Salmonella enterica]|nr:mobilization protein [Salmonella enterica]EJQ7236979.1 mobilization protein [Salmonella enterica subsp. enterica]EAX3725843.1 mobilization protein [Salmonella enterica]EAX5483904.1 mobilization protein [Salmonella enterica]EAY0447410.1 mobilization protein [Salmonella enterica]
MSSHLKMATDVRQKSSEQANATGQLLKQEFDRLGKCVSEALSLSGQKISDDIAARNRELSDALRHHSNGMTEAMQSHRESVMRLATRRWLSVLMTSLLLAGTCGGVLWLLSRKIAANLDEIAAQNATLEKLNAKTWGVTYLEDSNGRFLVLPKGMKAEAGWTVANGKRNAVKLVKE